MCSVLRPLKAEETASLNNIEHGPTTSELMDYFSNPWLSSFSRRPFFFSLDDGCKLVDRFNIIIIINIYDDSIG